MGFGGDVGGGHLWGSSSLTGIPRCQLGGVRKEAGVWDYLMSASYYSHAPENASAAYTWGRNDGAPALRPHPNVSCRVCVSVCLYGSAIFLSLKSGLFFSHEEWGGGGGWQWWFELKSTPIAQCLS